MNLSEKISRQVRAIPKSGIRDFFELVQARDHVISLGVGEPDFATPWHIREAAIYSLEKGETNYTSNLGLLSLRQSINRYVKEHFSLEYDPGNEILVTVGVSEALDLAFRALLNPGDEVIFHEPCYVSYSPSIAMAYGAAVSVPTHSGDDFALRASEVARRITPKTRVLVMNFPTNPTGAIEPEAELEKIAALCVAHDLVVVTDEIYSELRYGGSASHRSILTYPGMRERGVLLHGFSKAFAMTGFRLGYACAPPELTEAMMKIHQYSMLCAPMPSQMAALEALEHGQESVRMMREAYEKRRNKAVKRFNAMGLNCFEPGGAFYAFPDVSGLGLSSRDFAIRLLEEEDVAVVPGDAFGPSGEGFVRCCYATHPDLLDTALERIESFVNRLR